MSMKKKTGIVWLLILLIVGVVPQFITVKKPKVSTNNPADLLATVKVPKPIAKLLKASCYDCHSNETVYPWYASIAPVSWLVVRDVKEGRKHLNFSEWDQLKITKKAKALGNISDAVKQGDMPMSIYTFIHRKVRLSKEDRQSLVEWADSTADRLFGDD